METNKTRTLTFCRQYPNLAHILVLHMRRAILLRNDRSNTFRELRQRAQKELGPRFDIRTFHDEMLDGGTLPLDLLESRTDTWIAQQRSK